MRIDLRLQDLIFERLLLPLVLDTTVHERLHIFRQHIDALADRTKLRIRLDRRIPREITL